MLRKMWLKYQFEYEECMYVLYRVMQKSITILENKALGR